MEPFINVTSCTKLARKAGIKNISKNSYISLNTLALEELERIVDSLCVINLSNKKLTILYQDLKDTFSYLDTNVILSKNLVKK